MTGHNVIGGRMGSIVVSVAVGILSFFLASPILAQDLQWKFTTDGQTDVVDTANLGQAGYTNWTYFPTPSETDGRFLSICGADLKSLGGDSIILGIAVPKATDTLRIQIFDGETGGAWDLGTTALTYRLYADPGADAAGTTVVGTWSGSSMTDNAWYSIKVATSASARASDSSYFYRLVVSINDASQKTWSNFKFRTNGTAALLPIAFAYSVPLFSNTDAAILYPNFPSTTSSTYDGTWAFHLYMPEAIEALEVWDGDLDYGSYDGTVKDTDDVDTPNGVPAWADSNIVNAEGVATSEEFVIVNGVRSASIRATGSPADDNTNAYYRRSPSVSYQVVDPNGLRYTNSNPSGNLEWERFLINTIHGDRADQDLQAPVLPPGIYQLNVSGMDLGNLNAWRIGYDTLGTTDSNGVNQGDRSEWTFRNRPLLLGVDEFGNPVNMAMPKKTGTDVSLGYWRNHPNDWPVNIIAIGDTMLTKSQALGILRSASTNASMIMAKHLIAAKLNMMAGEKGTCIIEAVQDGDAWLTDYPLGCSNPNWTTGGPIKAELEAYNTGETVCDDARVHPGLTPERMNTFGTIE